MARYQPIAERFWPKVTRGRPDQCWEWNAHRNPQGYGKFQIRRQSTVAHRVAWQITNGPIPDELHVLHKCDNPPCCNPEHLFLGTDADNRADALAKGRVRVAVGTACHTARLTEADVQRIRSSAKTGKALARQYGVWDTTIYDIRNGKTWKHVP